MELNCSKNPRRYLEKLSNDKEKETLSGEILESPALDICSSI